RAEPPRRPRPLARRPRPRHPLGAGAVDPRVLTAPAALSFWVDIRRCAPAEIDPERRGRTLEGVASRPGGRGTAATVSRKVGTPQGRVLVNGQSGRPAGKCHREQTADGPRAQARVKRCGKSAPPPRATGAARHTPPVATPG